MWLVELEDSQSGPNTMMLFTKEVYAYDWIERRYGDGAWGDTYAGQSYWPNGDDDDPVAHVREVEVVE